MSPNRRSIRPLTRRLAVLTAVCLTAALGCTQGPSRSASMAATRQFLAFAAKGDSAGLATIAHDTMVSFVLRNRRLGMAQEFQAASQAIRRAKFKRYGPESEVIFRYVVRGTESNGYVSLRQQGERLEVFDYGLGVKFD